MPLHLAPPSLTRAATILALWMAAPVSLESQVVSGESRAAMNREVGEAGEAYDKWIGLIDARAFEAAWDQSAALFKKDRDRNMWVTTLYRLRDTISPITRRELMGTTFTRLLRPVSTADAVTFQVVVHFMNETLGVETVVLMKEDDGVYRVASYDFFRGPVITTPAPLGY